MADVTSAQRLAVLERLERGEITAAQAMALLEALPDRPWPISHVNGLNSRGRVLDLIDRGDITAGEALHRLGVNDVNDGDSHADSVEPPAEPTAPVSATPDTPAAAATLSAMVNASASEATSEDGFAARTSRTSQDAPPVAPEIESWRRWYQIPLAIGIAFIVLGSLLMYSALQASGVGFWFLCASVPLTLGVLLAVLAWLSRNGPWLHVRVRNARRSWPNTIAISLPIPVRLTAWALHTFGPDTMPLRDMSMDDLVEGLRSASPATPFYVDVAEGANGERVQVFIG